VEAYFIEVQRGWWAGVIVEGYQRETDEDSEAVRGRFDQCRCRSDSLAVISYRDINVFTTYVNTPDACLRRYLGSTT